MTNAPFLRRLLAEMLDAMEAEGYPLGPGKLLQVEELVKHLPPGTPPEALKTLLAPLFASTGEEQKRFYELFGQRLEIVQALFAEETAPGPQEEKIEWLKKSERRWRWVVIALAAALAVWGGIALYLYLQKPEPPPIASQTRTERFAVAQGQTDTRPLAQPGDTARLISAAFCDGQTVGETPTGSRFAIDTLAFSFTAGAEAPAGPTDTICAVADYEGRRDTIYFVVDITEGDVLPPPPADTGLIAEIPLPVSRNLSDLEIDPGAQARADFLRKYKWPLKAALFLILAGIAWALARWQQRRRARFVAEIEQRDQAPYVWHIKTGEEHDIDFGEGLSLLLNRLRRREDQDTRRLHVPATVRATVRQAGRATFVFRQQTRPPEYLLLIDRLDAHDHRARLFDALFAKLQQAEVLAERYFYQGDPRICFNEAHPHGVALGELLHRHRDARLLVVGEGHRLLTPSTGKLAPWTRLFEGWNRRALLLTNPTRGWGRREQQLAGLFTLAPASLQGVDQALEQFETLDPKPFRDTLRRVSDAVAEPFRFEDSLFASLRRHFPEPLIQWIAACAVYPAIYWDLTLFLGRELSTGEEPLLTSHNIRQLSRLPWFVEGRMPEGARIQLLEYLDAQGLERRVREAIDRLLSEAPEPPRHSAAYDDYRMNIVLNRLLLNPPADERRELEREFERFLAAGKKPDFVTFKLLERQATRLDLIVPVPLKKILLRHQYFRFGLKPRPLLAGVWLALAAAVAALPLRTSVCEGEAVVYEEKALCLDSPDDRLTYLELLARDAIEVQRHETVDSLRQEAVAIPGADTAAFYQNVSTHYYNFAARAYNNDLDSLACDNFSRGSALYTAVSGGVGYQFFEAMGKACVKEPSDTLPQPPALLNFSGQVVDAVTGDYIAGADVKVGNLSLRTRSGGLFQFSMETGQIGAEWQISASAPGYQEQVFTTRPKNPLPAIRLRPVVTDPDPRPDDVEQRRLQDSLREAQRRDSLIRLDDQAYQKAIAAGTAEAFETYLRDHPAGRHAAEAKDKIGRLTQQTTPPSIPRPAMVRISGGTFEMGDVMGDKEESDETVHTVTLSDFLLGATEVTFEEYDAYCEATGKSKPGDNGWGRGKRPVINVSWYDAVGYCNWLSEQHGYKPVYTIDGDNVTADWSADGYRLPTEAEWEYAARQRGQKVRFGNGKDIADPKEINFDGSAYYKKPYSVAGEYRGKTLPVQSFSPNSLGLYDMSGNVWEWCWDWYGDYSSGAQTNPTGPVRGSGRVGRGGSWNFSPRDCRVASRNYWDPEFRYGYLGFRLVLPPVSSE